MKIHRFAAAFALAALAHSAVAQTSDAGTIETSDSVAQAAADGTVDAGAVDVMEDARRDVISPVLIRAEAVEDASVYSVADAFDAAFWDSGALFGPVAAEWSELGQVEDLLIDDRGMVVGVTVDVGGFLGIGEKAVLIPMADMRLVQMPDAEAFYIVTRMSHDVLTEMAEVEGVIGDD